ncbi:hypothetical protein HSR6_1796 [Halodesulfurarchaeum formicicum]|uniref:Uncharacterized protein n=2 Tax=Halodesulfurarchaeum formicicum TaxID=1873524 RepID=A0A1J1AF70_9EURY|nr:hypothetical protein HSR6_1796 [Halodesulfurarchaeum formicicum]
MELDKRFDEYELLLDLHFILRKDVVTFVEKLPERLRRIRTETERSARTSRGGVDGRINWNATYKQRYSRNPRDTSVFVVENRTVDFDIPENIVLVDLLQTIYSTLNEADEYIRRDYDWIQDRWHENGELIDRLTSIMERNVNIKRIRSPEEYEPSERMLTTAENARQELYREAAGLLRSRNRLFRGEENEIRQLLKSTSIAPDNQDTLFELYVLFRFIAVLDDLRDESISFQTISQGRQEIARLPGSPEMVIYHDQAARDRDISFRTERESTLEDPIPRAQKVQTMAHEVAESYFKRDFEDHTGRPDVIVLEIRDEENDEYEYLITEVKNSKRRKTVRQGIKETLEYLAFLRVNEDFVFGREDNDDYFGSGWNGLLVVQDLSEETISFEDQTERSQPIRILQAREVEEGIRETLSRLNLK